ncbi:protein prenylyltransferase [Melanomma pulvis-pyrius CBS 109.77]|uniref:Protein prenylyltransferase n=1 Tax=Melanomma pulvis-pyrius CBS 109.77 TaxID=1314802 RepID=A0A6A6XEQ0_9PLEO|nr:protein prenylyltransferase [Melanomma pulvis-pyrius CBS 109.77]
MEPDERDVSSSDLQDQAYDALSEFFSVHEDEVVEIEILPPAIQPTDGLLMMDGLNVGVPKKILVLAYVKARQLFFASIQVDGTSLQALDASRVMLLFDPEHITVANFRKRRILNIKAEAPGQFIQVVIRELVFINSILTSPLHRQSKSPTLWHHRAWLLGMLIPIKLIDASGEQLLAFARAELDAVLKSGEWHPKNYYAWQYARRLLTRVESLYANDSDHAWKASYHEFLATCASLIRAWCCLNPSDISGWTFLSFLLPRLNSLTSRRRIVQQVLDYAINLQAKQESLWVFLRTVLADSILGHERDALIQLLHNFQKERAGAVRDVSPENCVMQADTWIKSYSKELAESRSSQTLPNPSRS